MPTSLPIRPSSGLRRPALVLVFLLAFAVASVVIEIVDPAPMDVEAAWVASP